MRKVLILAAIGVAVGVAASRLRSAMSNVDWEKRLEAMPENAPPKWMFRNISVIRDNTDQILDLLKREPASPGRG